MRYMKSPLIYVGFRIAFITAQAISVQRNGEREWMQLDIVPFDGALQACAGLLLLLPPSNRAYFSLASPVLGFGSWRKWKSAIYLSGESRNRIGCSLCIRYWSQKWRANQNIRALMEYEFHTLEAKQSIFRLVKTLRSASPLGQHEKKGSSLVHPHSVGRGDFSVITLKQL